MVDITNIVHTSIAKVNKLNIRDHTSKWYNCVKATKTNIPPINNRNKVEVYAYFM